MRALELISIEVVQGFFLYKQPQRSRLSSLLSSHTHTHTRTPELEDENAGVITDPMGKGRESTQSQGL